MTERVFVPKPHAKKRKRFVPALFLHVKHDALEYSDTCGKERRKVQNKTKKEEEGKFVFIKEIQQIGWFITLIG
jgi:hypothetical protein